MLKIKRGITKPEFDLIMAVDDLSKFHEQNLKSNYYHYTVFGRLTRGRVVQAAQRRGAKCHFNEIKVKKSEYLTLLEQDYEFPEK